VRLYKFILIVSLTICAARSVCFADDESLQAAILTQEMMMDIGKNGLSVLGKFADAKNIEVLKNVASKGGEMADVAERSLKILNAYNDGVRGDELTKLVTLEIGAYAYGKIKAKTMDYIKEHVTTVGQLTAAYDLLGTLHDSSYYIVYIGMSIGLDMMDPETVKKLEESKFTKAAEKVTELTNELMSNAKAGAEDIKQKFLAATEGSFLDRLSSGFTEVLSTALQYAGDGAKDLGGRIFDLGDRISDLLFGSSDDPGTTSPADDHVVSTGDTPGGDQVLSGQTGDSGDYGENGENVCPVTADSTPSGDFFASTTGNTAPGNGDSICLPGDDSAAETDATQYPNSSQAWENKDAAAGGNVPDSSGAFANLWGGHSLPDFTALMDKLADQAAIVGPNLPYRRILWMFSGESLLNTGVDMFSAVSNLFSSDDDDSGSYISEMKKELEKITGIGN